MWRRNIRQSLIVQSLTEFPANGNEAGCQWEREREREWGYGCGSVCCVKVKKLWLFNTSIVSLSIATVCTHIYNVLKSHVLNRFTAEESDCHRIRLNVVIKYPTSWEQVFESNDVIASCYNVAYARGLFRNDHFFAWSLELFIRETTKTRTIKTIFVAFKRLIVIHTGKI